MLSTILLIATATLSSFVSAQNQKPNGSAYSTSGPLTVTPSSVNLDLRISWCTGQRNNCPLICGGDASSNNCDPQTLTYQCTCANGNKPNISDYQDTMPFYICEQWIADCVAGHPNNLGGQTACQSVQCGQKNATTGKSSGSSSSSSASAGASASSTSSSSGSQNTGSSGGSGGSGGSGSSGNAAAGLNVGASYGTAILAVGMLALFGLAL